VLDALKIAFLHHKLTSEEIEINPIIYYYYYYNHFMPSGVRDYLGKPVPER